MPRGLMACYMVGLMRCISEGLCTLVQGVSHRHISDHLSELVETTLSDLEGSKVGLLTLPPASMSHGLALGLKQGSPLL